MILKCNCGGAIVFEEKKTMASPEEKQGICLKCKSKYRFCEGKLFKREKKYGTK